MKNAPRLLVALIASLVLLAGCVVPQSFEANMVADSSGFSLDYDGQLVMVPVFDSRKDSKQAERLALMEKFHNTMVADAARAQGEYEGTYTADGVLDTVFHHRYDYPAQRKKIDVTGILTVKGKGGGVYEITTPALDADARKKLAQMGFDLAKISGRFEFEPQDKVSVVEHNADSEPGLMSSAYGWNLDVGSGQAVRLVIRVD